MSEPAVTKVAAGAAPKLSLVQGSSLRMSRVRDARARIEAGYYDRDEVRSRLADAVLGLMRRP